MPGNAPQLHPEDCRIPAETQRQRILVIGIQPKLGGVGSFVNENIHAVALNVVCRIKEGQVEKKGSLAVTSHI